MFSCFLPDVFSSVTVTDFIGKKSSKFKRKRMSEKQGVEGGSIVECPKQSLNLKLRVLGSFCFNKTISRSMELCSFLEASFDFRWRRKSKKMKHHELNSVTKNIKIKKSVHFHTS